MHGSLTHGWRARTTTVLAVLLAGGIGRAQGPEPFTPDDLFRAHTIGRMAWSPDGDLIAIALVGPGNELGVLETRTELVLVDATSGELTTLASGLAEERGYWSPVWSPEGGTLAFLTADASGSVHPALWRRGEASFHTFTDVDIRLGFGDPPIVWADEQHVLFQSWRDGANRSGSLYFQLVRGRNASQLWDERRRGTDATVSVLESGPSASIEPAIEPTVLRRHDVATGQTNEVLEQVLHRPVVSPDGRHVAFFVPSPGLPREPVASFLRHAELYDSVNWGTALAVADLDAGEIVAGPVNLLDPDYFSLRWSSSGTRLVAMGRHEDGSGQGPLLLFDEAGLRHVEVEGVGPILAARWLGDELVVRARDDDSESGNDRDDGDRADWWKVNPGPPINLTGALPPSAGAPVLVGHNDAIVEAEGDLWRLDLGSASSPATLLTSELDAVSGSRALSSEGAFYARVGGQPTLLHFDGQALHSTTIPVPLAGTTPRALSPNGDAAILTGSDDDGTRMWLTRTVGELEDQGASHFIEVWHGNSWIANKRRGVARHLEYTSISGRTLNAWLLVPPGRGPFPMVVDIYPGAEYDAEPPYAFELTNGHFLHPQLFAELGYAVLLPSMPAPDDPTASNPIDELTDGVLPALDAAIATGTIDGSRMAVVGQSAGGYSTLASSHRLTGSVPQSPAPATPTSKVCTALSTGSGATATAAIRRRVSSCASCSWSAATRTWAARPGSNRSDIATTARSPTSTRSARTPLMLVHGDMDFIPIQQAEQMFTALYRLDRDVRLVRYHGEQHTVSGRANVLDLWTRIESWLDSHLAPAGRDN